ncbi:hypothetical protein D3C72_1797100 [compost metagenome]
MPIWRVEPSSMRSAMMEPMSRSTSEMTAGSWVIKGRSVRMKRSILLRWTKLLPRVRGICLLISAITMEAVSTAARAVSTEVPRLQ